MTKLKTYLHLAIFCFIALNTEVIAQNKFSKSSFNRQKEIGRDDVSRNLYYAESIFEDSLSRALTIIEDNLIIAIENDFIGEEALAYRILGDFNKSLSNNALAISKYKKSIKLYNSENNNIELYKLLMSLGSLEITQQQNSKAVSSFKKAMDIAIKMNDVYKEISALLNVGNTYLANKDVNKSEEIYKQALKKSNIIKAPILIIKSTIGLGKTAKLNSDYTKAEGHFLKAQSLAEKMEFDDLTNETFNLLTELYNLQNNNDQEIQIQQRAFNFNSIRGNNTEAIQNNTNISNSYIQQGKTDEALNILNLRSELHSTEDNTKENRDYIKTLANIYSNQGLTKESDSVNLKYNQLVDSFKTENEFQKQIQATKNEYLQGAENKLLLMEKDRELNEKMIDILKREQTINNKTIERQTTLTYLLIGGLIVFGIMAFFLYRSSRQKQNANQLLVLKSLRNQMNPHFIFNSLNSVNSFIAKKDERSANKYLAEFSKLMREVLECSLQDFIPLSKEIDILKLYLNLEHFRFNSHFDFTFEVDKSINLDDYQIPPMLLQPFIENAIWHGLRYKENKGMLNLSFTQKDGYVEVIIQDNGIGREKSKSTKTLNQKKMKSTGIKNVENRLEIIKNVFKKDLQITIKDMDKETNEGTIVTLKLY